VFRRYDEYQTALERVEQREAEGVAVLEERELAGSSRH
jgi:hypothetical protein